MAESEDEYGVAPGAVRAAVADQLPLLLPLLASPEPEVRRIAAWAVSHTRATAIALPALRAHWDEESEPSVRAEVLAGITARPAGRSGGRCRRSGPLPAGRGAHGRRLRLPRRRRSVDRAHAHHDAVPSARRHPAL
ncbi:HEAT repeat domain-containing protein [Streptomyces tendae]